MALVRKFEKFGLQVEKVHGEVNSTYTAFRAADGKSYFQIDTYGSPERKLKGKKSQTIQLDEGAAKELIALLRAEFSL
ncbi:MAG: hypothetical protein K2X44_09675 [Magnetospirillum sp.]|nr:hypothetical protein [Magnetospirillum sp.]